jgi:hypothetical protein
MAENSQSSNSSSNVNATTSTPTTPPATKEEERLNRIIYEGTALHSWGLGMKKRFSVKEKNTQSAPVTPTKSSESVTSPVNLKKTTFFYATTLYDF